MKNIVIVFVIAAMFSSCADTTQAVYKSRYQKQTLTKFSKKKGYRKASANYVPFRKQGAPNTPTVTKETRKAIKQSRN
jgi:hypothetical protein